jgi:hypothetical protein
MNDETFDPRPESFDEFDDWAETPLVGAARTTSANTDNTDTTCRFIDWLSDSDS